MALNIFNQTLLQIVSSSRVLRTSTFKSLVSWGQSSMVARILRTSRNASWGLSSPEDYLYPEDVGENPEDKKKLVFLVYPEDEIILRIVLRTIAFFYPEDFYFLSWGRLVVCRKAHYTRLSSGLKDSKSFLSVLRITIYWNVVCDYKSQI